MAPFPRRTLATVLFVPLAGLLVACGSQAGPPEATNSPVPSSTPRPAPTDTSPPPETDTPAPASSPTPDPAAEPGLAFERTFGGSGMDRGVHVIQTADGGFAVTGVTASSGSGGEDVYLLRLDPDGQELWSHAYGGSNMDNGWSVHETEDGGFTIAGYTRSEGAGGIDVYLIRTDLEGEMLWANTFGGPADDYGWAMQSVAGDGYVIAGQTESFGAGDIDGYLIKVDANGRELWSQTYGGPQRDRLFAVRQAPDGGFIIAGITYSFGEGGRNAYVVKTDKNGALQWQRTFGQNGDDVAHSVDTTKDGGYLVTGYTSSFGAEGYDAYLVKLDASGETEWTQMFGGPADDRIITGRQTTDTGYILIGYTKSFGVGNWDVYLVKSDPLGNPLWQMTFGQTGEDVGYTVQQTAEGGYVATGHSQPTGPNSRDLYLIHLEGLH